MRRVERGRAVGERRRRPLAGGRQRDGGDAARDERPLFVEREREAEVDQLLRRARRAAPACRSARARASRPSRRATAAGERGLSPVITMRGGPRPAIASRLIVATTWNGECSAKRSAPSPPKAPPSVERKTIVCAERTRWPRRRAGLRVAARELDQRGGAARVVVRAGPGARVVPVRHHDDRVGRLARRDRPQVAQPDVARGRARAAFQVSDDDGQAVRRELVAEPLRRRSAIPARREPGPGSGSRARSPAAASPARRSSAAGAAPAGRPAG